MIYGLWSSATGVMTATYKQSVITNNLANGETTGFKRDLVNMQERRLAAQELPNRSRYSDPFFNNLGGGTLLSPTAVDHTQGQFEQTDNPLDVAIAGDGYFVMQKDGQQYLSRNGNFILNSRGQLISATEATAQVIGRDGAPIVLNPNLTKQTEITPDGQIAQAGVPVASLAIKSHDPETLKKIGQHLLAGDDISAAALKDAASATVRNGMLERSNVDTPTELTEMMETQRLLEANANMIRYQDQTLGRCVNDVGKVS